MTLRISVHKADAIKENEAIESCILSIDQGFVKSDFETLDKAQSIFISDAKWIDLALKHLPQGTRHQLLLLMLEDAKCHYVGV